MRRRTKIVCTLGPATDDRAKIAALVEAGMNVARLNCSHGDWESKARWVGWLRELSPRVGPLAILADLQGPKFRVGELAGGAIELTAGGTVAVGRGQTLAIEQEEILRAMAPNGRLLFGDGEIEVKLTSGGNGVFQGRVISGGTLKSRKGVTLVGKVFDVPALTAKDEDDLREAVALGVDYVALSYVKHADDVRLLRSRLDELDPSVGICAKIETRDAVREIEEILGVVDLVMVARGDMGLQMDFEDVPAAQKRIIRHANRLAVPVITATQMLESMMTLPRPTRAEVTDVYNAILDGTDAVMLSGETAAGQYPVDCVRAMDRIAQEAEKQYDRFPIEREFRERARGRVAVGDSIAHAAAEIARQIGADALVTPSTSGQTPRLISKFRPSVPLYCATPRERTARRLAPVWGVESVVVPAPDGQESSVENALTALRDAKRLRPGDEVVLTAGSPAGVPGNTNLTLVRTVR